MLPSLKIEKRLVESRSTKIIVPILSLFLALLLGSVLLLLVGANPWDTYIAMFSGALGGRYAFSETLLKATPIILCALGVSIAFRMLFWNIGAEGQLAMGAFAAAGVALFVPTRYPDLPSWIAMALAFCAAALAGAIWILIPALLKAYMNVNEIITTLMLNYVAILWIAYLYYGSWKDPKGYGFPGSAQFVKAMWLGRIQESWIKPAILVLAVGIFLGLGLSLVMSQVSRRRAWFGLGAGVVAMALGWVASPYLSQIAISLTVFLTQGWLLPEGGSQAATAALLWLTPVLALLMLSLSKVSQDVERSDATGAVAFAGALFLGGAAIGQVVLMITLLAGTRVHTGFLVCLVGAVFIWLVLGRTKWGYEIRVIGENPRAAKYAGISLARNIVLVAMLSGGLAGLAGLSEVLGVAHRLQTGLTVGYGYTAILVAWMAGLNPWAILMWGILWAALLVGGDQIQITMGLPAAVAPTLQGLMVFCVLGGQYLVRHRVRLVWPSSRSLIAGSSMDVNQEGGIES
jgi:ABC-type uncharacterized transport system permease subunit